MVTKYGRQQAILRLVRNRDVATQLDLVHELQEQGIEVNQSTVSRDIKDLGLVKAPSNGHYAYALPDNHAQLAQRNWRILREFITAIDGSAHLAVVHTDSGNAHPVAEAVDRLELADVVGTIAGDNTLLVILREGTTWQQFRDALESKL